MKFTSLASFLLAAGTAVQAHAQQDPYQQVRGFCTGDFTVGVNQATSTAFHLGTCNCQGGWASPIAVAAAADLTSGPHLPNTVCGDFTPDPISLQANSSAFDPCPQALRTVSASAQSGGAAGSATAWVQGLVAGRSSSMTSKFGVLRIWSNDSNGACLECPQYNIAAFGSAWAASPRSYHIVSCTDPLAFNYEQAYELIATGSANANATYHCTPGENPCENSAYPAVNFHVTFSSIDVQVVPESGSDYHAVRQGVLAVKGDGSVLRLGTFTGPNYAPVPTANGFSISVQTSETIPLPAQNGAFTLVDGSALDSFSTFGDLDRDGSLCRADLLIHMTLWGAVINSPQYTARADADLDGDIDGDDASIIWSTLTCRADFNCDGVADQGDISDLINAIAEGAPFTDINDDGNSDQSDVSYLITVIATGC